MKIHAWPMVPSADNVSAKPLETLCLISFMLHVDVSFSVHLRLFAL